MVKRLPTVRETQVQSLGREDLLEKGMATHSSIPAWKIPWMEESGRLYSPWGRKESDTTERLHFPFHFHFKQCSLFVSFYNLDCKEMKPVDPKGNQCWIFTGRTDAEAEAPILWPPDEKSWLIAKDPEAGKDRRQERKGMTKDKMLGWHHWLNGQV